MNRTAIDNEILYDLFPPFLVFTRKAYSVRDSKMAKKRKATRGANQLNNDAFQETSASDNKLRVNTYEDVADSEDEFHINRDKILLEEGPVQKKQRRSREEGMTSGNSIRSPGNVSS